MRMHYLTICLATTMLAGVFPVPAAGQEEPTQKTCKAVHADMVEVRTTEGCKPGDGFCFLGEVDGNHGLRGKTYFKGEIGALFPPTAPDYRSYTGRFEYTTEHGWLRMHEMGLSNPSVGNPDSGVVSAFQLIVEGTGEFAGATGYLFVNGFNRNQRVVTSITGEICTPAPIE